MDPRHPSAAGTRGRLAVGGLLVTALALAGSAAAQKSVTVDEFAYLPHGLAVLKTGDFHLATHTPPLSSLLPALPLLATSAQLDTTDFADHVSVWECGARFMAENGDLYHHSVLLGRLVSLGVLLLCCLCTYGLARSLYGPAGGLVAAAFTCLSPNLLAHGPLVTPDIYLTAALVGSLWAFDVLLRRPGWRSAAALGLALGAAGLSKHTGVLLFAIYPVVLACLQLTARFARTAEPAAPSWRRVWLAVGLALLLGLAVINVGYAGDRVFTPLRDFTFETERFQRLQEALPGWLPVPVPYYFFKGMDAQLAEEGYTAYLLGEFNREGFWHYYLVGLLVKTPVPVLALCGLAWVCGGRVGRREAALLATAGLLFGFFSLTRHKNIGMRYVLFLEPLMAVWVGRLAAAPCWTSLRHGRWVHGAVGLGAAWLLLTALIVWPNYLAYFNWASGGPANGHRYLLDSNLDWGQDLITLRRYMERHRIDSVDLAYFGRVDPKVYGVRFNHLGAGPVQRYVAISSNLLWGRMYFVNGTGYWPEDRDTYAAFRRLRPRAVLGHTIYLYDLADVPLRR